MRQGRLAATLLTSETTPDEVVAYITGARGPQGVLADAS